MKESKLKKRKKGRKKGRKKAGGMKGQLKGLNVGRFGLTSCARLTWAVQATGLLVLAAG